MIVLYQILAFTIVLGIIVFVHELGHFVAARLMGVRVEVFSFGIGKRLFGKRIGQTDFRVSMIPLGGFVKMAGEDEFETKDAKADEFHSKNRAQKIFILVMGPVMNLLLSFVILTVVSLSGVETESHKSLPPRIGYVEIDSPAFEAGIRKGDLIFKINGSKIPDWRDLEMAIRANPDEEIDVLFDRNGIQKRTRISLQSRTDYNVGYAGLYWDHKTEVIAVQPDSPADQAGLEKGDVLLAVNGTPINYFEISDIIAANAEKPVKFIVQRGEQIMEKTITPQLVENRGMVCINMIPHSPTVTTHYSLLGAFQRSIREIGKLTFLTFNAFRKLIIGKLSPKNLSGPIEIAKFSQRAMESGLSNFFILIAFISLQLGIINLFPIPVLDGGHLMIYSIEAVIRREINPKVKSILMNAGLVFLVALMIFVVLNDVAKALPNGWKSLLPF